MELPPVGAVVLVPFPYADFTRFKKRPAVVTGIAEFNNLILCQITSQAHTSKRAITLTSSDFSQGGLPIKSYARPDKLFTIERSLIQRQLGVLTKDKTNAIKSNIRSIFRWPN